MKKLFIIGLILVMAGGIFNTAFAEEDPAVIKGAIAKYKNKNYIGCISDLRIYTEKDPSSAIAWYYLGNSYMNISMKQEAHAAYEKVVSLNSVPVLTSYSIQAQMCMQNPARCSYQNFTLSEIEELKKDPTVFLEQYFANMSNKNEDANNVEIEKLINGEYSNNIHPDASNFIRQEKTKMKQNEINVGQYFDSQNQKLVQALEMLKDQNEASNFAMMLDTPPTQSNNYNNLIQQYQNNNQQKITPEMIQMMMMQNTMPNF